MSSVRLACVRVWERACVSLTRGTVMNRGCVFASRDLARCGTLQKCGQAVAAAAAAETASQEPSPASPTSQRCGRTLGESLQTSSGRGEDAGSPNGWTGGCAGARSLLGAEPAAATSPAGLPAAGGHTALERTSLSEGHLALRGSGRGSLQSGQALLAFTPPAAPAALSSMLAGIITSSPPLPQVTAAAFAAARGQFTAAEPLRQILPGTA